MSRRRSPGDDGFLLSDEAPEEEEQEEQEQEEQEESEEPYRRRGSIDPDEPGPRRMEDGDDFWGDSWRDGGGGDEL